MYEEQLEEKRPVPGWQAYSFGVTYPVSVMMILACSRSCRFWQRDLRARLGHVRLAEGSGAEHIGKPEQNAARSRQPNVLQSYDYWLLLTGC